MLNSGTHAQAANLTIGVVPGVYADSVAVAAQEAKAEGLDVKVVEFSDWTTPNVALAAGDLDLNYFQNKLFAANASRQRGYTFADVGLGTLLNVGLYSLKHASFEAIPKGGSVAVPNDPVNQGRALLLLQKAGLVRLKDGVGAMGTLDDIVENPKKLVFTEVEGPQLARITSDVDLAVGYPHFIIASKAFDPGRALLFSGLDDVDYAVRFYARRDNADNPDIRKFVKIYQTSAKVRTAISKGFADNPKLYSIVWAQ
ncbi:D-methionine transport system substrate-binding protein [Methylobacterium sp. ap11]|uniref:MetQ/NlpA family ABC transporter substrate-binding protein n=1 Tax=Methylobacterium sp. ap11 TaxID=1761799 RepID=UPI0008BA8ED2|nr:MetQ/NlpA family ABC transporter substrate-binding protein [Methylobacterium sp. ap11]SEP49901.1 D-methionine transport system substrate-binding protein [Methylobacterium sp. ap11]